MKARRNRRGFTMAEMLIVVAIIAALAGVSFIAVQRYQRSMAQLEYDAIAKEIFVAAQNHLTVAEGQDFLNITEYGTVEDAEKEIYYFISNKGNGFGSEPSLLDLMLPFGSVDETVRAGGNFLIRYQKSPAAVLDVFYSESTSGRFEHEFSESEYTNLLNVRDSETVNNKSTRRDYANGSVLGWYGGTAAQEMGGEIKELKPPTIKVENEEQLRVIVTDTNWGRADEIVRSLKLIIEGKASGAKAAIALMVGSPCSRLISSDGGVYTLVLDDVTREGWHFYQLKDDASFDKEDPNNPFLPGEDITLSAVTCGVDTLTNIAYSNAITTNSLFAGVEDVEPARPEPSEDPEGSEGSDSSESAGSAASTVRTAQIANFRHLENLSNVISGLDTEEHPKQEGRENDLKITAAVQLEDLDWPAFDTVMGGSVSVYSAEGSTDPGCYMPINPNYALDYDGQGHWIKGVQVGIPDEGEKKGKAYEGDAGLFGSTVVESSISNLALVNFSISATGSAGALAGTLKDTNVENVVAYFGAVPVAAEPVEGAATPSPSPTAEPLSTTEPRIASGDSAGGLVGKMNGGSVTRSAAALYVSGKDAGGLVGTSENANYTACYSGGHTNEGKYEDAEGAEPKYSANISATGTAGGLIGSMTGGTATGCYSTCSVSGATAGGMAGSASGGFANCYATGLVTGSAKAGAFAGTLSGGGSASVCLYLEIINEQIVQEGEGKTVRWLPAVSGDDEADEPTTGITAADADAAFYAEFMGDPNKDPSDWVEAKPYDLPTLQTYYGGKYPLKSLERLNDPNPLQNGDFVKIHYGDWPAPETFVMN